MSELLRVVVYVKPGCTLCEPVMKTLERVREDVAFTLEKVDISGDAELTAKYGLEIPVVTIDGRKAFKGRVEEAAFRKKLKRARQVPRSEGLDVDALEALETDTYVPPKPAALLFVLLAVGTFLYFVARGVADAENGQGRLAGQLLQVATRADDPARFSLESMTGGKLSLEDYRGKVVFLNFWATWCPPCVEEMPSMLRLHERMKDESKFVMLAVSADEGWAPVRQFFADKGTPQLPVLLDQSGKIAKEYGTTMFPETYVIVDGKIVGFIEGPRDWDDWYAEAYLRSLL